MFSGLPHKARDRDRGRSLPAFASSTAFFRKIFDRRHCIRISQDCPFLFRDS
jgi:hypothetical protein